MRPLSSRRFRLVRRLAHFSTFATAAASGAAALGAVSCGGEAPPPYPPSNAVVAVQTESPDAPPAVRDDGRLPQTVTPLRVALKLSIDPSSDHFSGSERILFHAEKPTWHVVLNAKALKIKEAVAISGKVSNTATTTTRVAHGGFEPEELVLSFAHPIPAGDGEIDLSWDAGYSPNLMGISREQDEGRWYAYTDLEPTHARDVFPMFDEPSYKVPYDVTVRAPSTMTAFSNSPETARVAEKDGTTTFSFDTTRPLPSYLVAVAIGDMDIRTAEGSSSPPVRVLTTKGKGAQADLSLKDGVGLTAALAKYFGIAYPYPKLDLVAVPDFAPGAMENPGLITFREVLLLADPAHTAANIRRRQERVIAHELAHQWFGDLVTLAWWNDTWLNEGFASWAETKAVEGYRPESRAVLERVPNADAVMNEDALASARAVRQPVSSVGQAMEAFDKITYDKGAAVIGMLESWAGEKEFQTGVHNYLTAHSWGNATAADLFAELGKASGKDVAMVASSFVDRSGVPEVSVAIDCKHGAGKDTWTVESHETEWHPLGAVADGAPSKAASWVIPVCVRGTGADAASCGLLSASTPRKFSGEGKKCPVLIPNAGMHGYYRSALNEADTLALAKEASRPVHKGETPALTVTERLGVISDTWAGVRSGRLPPSVILQVLPMFDHDDERLVTEQVITTLRAMNDALVDDVARPAFRTYVKARLAAQKARLGWTSKRTAGQTGPSADPEDPSLLRRNVILALGEVGGDEATLKEADTYARAWIADPQSVDANIAQIAVELASHPAKADRIAMLAAPSVHGATPEVRVLALRASAQFDDPAVQSKALDRLLTDDVKKQDVPQVLLPAVKYRGSRDATVKWVEANWDALRAKMSGALARQLVTAAGYVCTQADYDQAKAFFTPRAKDVEGASRILSGALETSTLCTALHTAAAPAVSTYFKAGESVAKPKSAAAPKK